MRIPPLAVGLAVVVTLLLSGCLPLEPTVTPTPQPSSTPVFASEEEALAAAEAAYARYQAAVDDALATYNTDQLDGVAVGEALDAALESVAGFEAKQRKLTGQSSIEKVELAQAGELLGEGDGPIQIYGCLVIAGTDVVDATGQSVVVGSRPDRIPMIVTLEFVVDRGALLVSEADVWDGDDFCA